MEVFARFFIGNSREHADIIFNKLKGTHDVKEKSILFVDFIETKDGLPVNFNMMTCSLNQSQKIA
ncbi:MAG: hypothetical protein JJE22_00620 [Bacteroidia bacterium]|nr:hypothetical protein [Bacteroidia bacterium]